MAENGSAKKEAGWIEDLYSEELYRLNAIQLGLPRAVQPAFAGMLDAKNGTVPIRYGDMLQIWLENIRITVQPQSWIKYKSMIEGHISPLLGGRLVGEIDVLDINRFLSDRRTKGSLLDGSPLSASYVATLAYIIQASLNMAAAMQLRHPLLGKISKPPKARQELRIFSREEQTQLEQYLRCRTDDKKLGTLLCFYTGLRIGEICALQWSDIALDEGLLYVRGSVKRIGGKGHKTQLVVQPPKTLTSRRTVPLPSHICGLIENYPQRRATGFVMRGTRYEYVDPRALQYNFGQYLEKCGLPKLNFHAIRHTFATRCIEVGMDTKTLSEILGHASVNITLNTYVHSSMKMKKEQMERLLPLGKGPVP